MPSHDPHAALAEVLDHPAAIWRIWLAMAHVLEATARDKLGDPARDDSAFERALDLAEPDGAVRPFLFYSAPGLVERHTRHRTAHASLLTEIQRLSGAQPSSPAGPQPLLEPPSASELRVLRCPPTNLTAPEITRELHVSLNTVNTHVRSLYVKLGTHRRAETVDCASALGLLVPSGTGRASRHERESRPHVTAASRAAS